MTCAPGCRGLLDFDRDRQQLSSGFTVIAARFAEQQCRNGRNNANCQHNDENSEKTEHISCSEDSTWPELPIESLLKAISLMIDLGGRNLVHHREKLIGNRHRRAGLIVVDEEHHAARVAVLTSAALLP
jgi:hypothetical protein